MLGQISHQALEEEKRLKESQNYVGSMIIVENAIVLLQTFIPSCCEASTAARSKSSFGKSESWQVEDSTGVVEVGGGVVVVVVQLYPNSSSSEVVPEK